MRSRAEISYLTLLGLSLTVVMTVCREYSTQQIAVTQDGLRHQIYQLQNVNLPGWLLEQTNPEGVFVFDDQFLVIYAAGTPHTFDIDLSAFAGWPVISNGSLLNDSENSLISNGCCYWSGSAVLFYDFNTTPFVFIKSLSKTYSGFDASIQVRAGPLVA
ncbi:hypothetical protein ACT3CD_06005 [Geofilum sp. OHC36d9]|uniref:hypothetical protein n=1 Tax=Geofilum sp. OHC36d9 TaxID=3458413 RepID=UPI0040336122